MEAKMSEVIQSKTDKVWMDGGICRVEVLAGADYTLEAARRTVRNVLKLSGGKKVPVLVHMSNIKSMDREAREYYAGEGGNKCAVAVAQIVNSPIARIIGNFYLGISKPEYPLRLFESEEEAAKWLKAFLICLRSDSVRRK